MTQSLASLVVGVNIKGRCTYRRISNMCMTHHRDTHHLRKQGVPHHPWYRGGSIINIRSSKHRHSFFFFFPMPSSTFSSRVYGSEGGRLTDKPNFGFEKLNKRFLIISPSNFWPFLVFGARSTLTNHKKWGKIKKTLGQFLLKPRPISEFRFRLFDSITISL